MLEAPSSGPLVLFYAPVSSPYGLYALDSAKGTTLWKVPIEGVSSSAALGPDGTVYIGSYYSVVAVNGQTGSIRWRTPVNAQVSTSPSVSRDGTVYSGGGLAGSGTFYALDGITGAVKWTITVGGQIQSPSAIGANGTVYFGCNDGKVYAIK